MGILAKKRGKRKKIEASIVNFARMVVDLGFLATRSYKEHYKLKKE